MAKGALSQPLTKDDIPLRVRQLVQSVNELTLPQPAIPDATFGTELATINSILAMLRKRGVIEP